MLRSATVVFFLATLTTAIVKAADDCTLTWRCMPTTNNTVTLDADLGDWKDVEGITTDLVNLNDVTYASGPATYKCVYDDERVYLALEIPGDYRFNETDNNQCAAIATMMKVRTYNVVVYVNVNTIRLMLLLSSLDWCFGNLYRHGRLPRCLFQ